MFTNHKLEFYYACKTIKYKKRKEKKNIATLKKHPPPPFPMFCYIDYGAARHHNEEKGQCVGVKGKERRGKENGKMLTCPAS